ncbi:Dot/Icm T4SS effector kinase LegK1 [Legionella longbeachae]|uniref:Putative serine/threonine-protein kinase n=1 Tax=Legionella longbeachae serogroup 1 (strain NSW150) TaxID=661367 RepID=D3HT16_LEGLN|nr:Dot/Icm T4SS effector kinase LegK1 [Legionella longbeachae]VEE02549.1 serine/threonine-protein kinase [Legionella oakridgensis]HBD7398807.1 protein kinase [Legionella pneumophila]ARB91184.1 serine/threonine protein kinase [Legionella longbeachae]ARM32389.1 protein kinase [Legionella longbeachae]EEZ94810.1 serine/threonine-protein kinase [Legionella longbeachae D-4968]
MSIKINLDPTQIHGTNLGEAERNALQEFLKNKHLDNMWLKNQEYQYTTTQGIEYIFCFSKSLLRRKRSKLKEGERFEIFDLSNEPLGQGGYAVVYPILGTIKFEANYPILKTGKNRIVKIEKHHEYDRSHSVLQEYNNLVHVGHLGPKPPVFVHNNGKKSLLVMKLAKGIPLETILNPNKRKKYADFIPILTVEKRLEITFAILDAVKEQVIDKNLIHRDLKPGNMIIDLSRSSSISIDMEGNTSINPPSKVTIIDYGNAIIGNRIERRRVGTAAYRPPELYLSTPSYTQKSDAYAVGRILSYLWGDDYKNYYLDHKSPWIEIKKKTQNNNLFSDPQIALFKKDEDQIRECLNGLLKEDITERWSVEKAKQSFLKVNLQKYQIKKIRHASKIELRHYEKSIEKQIQTIVTLISRLSKKGNELIQRGFGQEGKKAEYLANKLKEYTEALAKNPDPTLFKLYRTKCLIKIDSSRKMLQKHRDSRWIVAEIITAISLLGIGYLFALGINYKITGRLGLFSQTKSDQTVEKLRNSIYQLS